MPVVDFYMKGVTNEELSRVSFVCTCMLKEDMDRVSKELNLNLDTDTWIIEGRDQHSHQYPICLASKSSIHQAQEEFVVAPQMSGAVCQTPLVKYSQESQESKSWRFQLVLRVLRLKAHEVGIVQGVAWEVVWRVLLCAVRF